MRTIRMNPIALPAPVTDAVAGSSPLTQWWVPAVALILAVFVSGWAIHRWRRERPRWLMASAAAGAVLLWLVVMVLAANAWFAFVPDLTALLRQAETVLGLPVSYRTAMGGHVKEHVVPADSGLAMPASSVWVYTPPGYDPAGTTGYPVVYLLHGYPGTSSNWFTSGRADAVMDAMIRTGMISPAIIVSPDVNGGGSRDGECLDSRDGGPQVETWLYEELVPWVDKSFLTHPDWEHRILGGMSSGGYCALDQGLRHPDVWGGIIALEPYGDPGRDAAAAMGYDRSAFDRVSPSHYIPTMHFPRPIPIFLDVGQLSDTLPAEMLANALTSRGQDVLFQVETGQSHTWQGARVGLPYGLAHVAPALGWK